MGRFNSDICTLDIETLSWRTFELEKNETDKDILQPQKRESSQMVYDHKDSRLVMFGGWSNEGLGDLWSLNVSQIVGPPYAIRGIKPNKGPLTGNTKVKIEGVGFEDVNNIKLVFLLLLVQNL
jgi:hypothetical protein